MPADDLIAIAHILRPQGRKGEVLAELLTSVGEHLNAGRAVRLATPANSAGRDHILEDHWLPAGKNAGRIVLKFADVNSISEAETLAALDVLIPAAELPALEEGTFYVGDLVDCTLFDNTDPVGRIVDVQFATSADGKIRLQNAAPLLVVDAAGSKEPVLVPFAKTYLQRVDILNKRVEMTLPGGLTDLAAPEARDKSDKV